MSSKPKKKIQKRKERVKPKIDVTNEELIKITVLYLWRTISGFPQSSFTFFLNLNPFLNR